MNMLGSPTSFAWPRSMSGSMFSIAVGGYETDASSTITGQQYTVMSRNTGRIKTSDSRLSERED